MRSRLFASLGPLLCLALSSVAQPALANDAVSAENKAAARELAFQGIELAQSGDCAAALPKLKRAESLYHAPTILTWIGQCQVETGQLVEGTETLKSVMRENLEPDAPGAFRQAQAKAKELHDQAVPRIGRLTVEVLPAGLEDLSVTVDGQPMSAALIGAPRPTDPGTHEIVVEAPGYESVTRTIELDESQRESLTIELQERPNAVASPPPNTPDPAPTQETPGQEETAPGSGTQMLLGWVGVGVGGALLAGGGVFGAMAVGEKNGLDCPNGSCPESQWGQLDDAHTFATTSTVLFGVGGAVATAGVVLLLTGGKKKTAEVDVAGMRVEPRVGWRSVGINAEW